MTSPLRGLFMDGEYRTGTPISVAGQGLNCCTTRRAHDQPFGLHATPGAICIGGFSSRRMD